MSTPNQAAGNFCWFERGSRDAAASKSFYSGLFGWKAEDMTGDFGTYTLLKAGDEDVAGLYTLGGPQFRGGPAH